MKLKKKPSSGFRRTAVLSSALCLGLLPSAVYADSLSGSAAASAGQVTDASPDRTAPAVPAVPKENTPAPVAKITEKQAVERVRSLFPVLREAKADHVELGDPGSYPPGNQNVWTIHWMIERGGNGYGFSSRIDSVTGELLSIHLYGPQIDDNQSYYPPRYTREQALDIANSFIHKASPSLSPESLELSSEKKFSMNKTLFGPVVYDFAFKMSVNGIPSPEGLYMTVNGNGEVVSYDRRTINGTYPSPKADITAEAAAKRYKDTLRMKLAYTPIFNPANKQRDWFLAWMPSITLDTAIDAKTGDFINHSGDKVSPEQNAIDVPEREGRFSPVSGHGKDGLITAEKAAELVKRQFAVPEGRTLSSHYLGSYRENNRQTWILRWRGTQPEGPYPKETSASVDAVTGQILEFREEMLGSPFMNDAKEKPEVPKTITDSQAADKAYELLNRLYPDAAKEMKHRTPSQLGAGDNRFQFLFQRYYNGIEVTGDVAVLTLDGKGEPVGYYAVYSDGLDQKTAGLTAKVTEADAFAAHLGKRHYRLQYEQFGGFYTEFKYVEPQLRLVYRLTDKVPDDLYRVLDAVSGQWRATVVAPTRDGKSPSATPKDIAGHWAQAQLETLFEYGILSPDAEGSLHPDDGLTLGEWLDMMARAVSPYYMEFYYSGNESKQDYRDVTAGSPYFRAVQLFVQKQWLEPGQDSELKPEQILTREKLAELLVAIVGYDKLAAQIGNSVTLPHEDEGEITARGAVALVSQLKLMNGSDGRFDPKGEVSRAQAAVVLMKLVFMQGKLDQIIGN